jgi:hypothetical protein
MKGLSIARELSLAPMRRLVTGFEFALRIPIQGLHDVASRSSF